MIHYLEALLSRMAWLRFLLPAPVVEPCARCVAAVAGALFSKNPFGIERRVRGFLAAPRFGATGLSIDRNLQLEGVKYLRLAKNVTLYAGSHYVAGRAGEIHIGGGTHIGRNAVLSGLGGIEIGRGCAISSLVAIYSQTNHYCQAPLAPIADNPIVFGKVTIGDDVWIGAGAVILPGVTIGDHAVVGAGAVVNRDVEPWQIVVGIPARVLKDRRQLGAAEAPQAEIEKDKSSGHVPGSSSLKCA